MNKRLSHARKITHIWPYRCASRFTVPSKHFILSLVLLITSKLWTMKHIQILCVQPLSLIIRVNSILKKKYLPTFCSSWRTTTYGSTKTYAQKFTLLPYLSQSDMLMLPQRQQFLQTYSIYCCGLTTSEKCTGWNHLEVWVFYFGMEYRKHCWFICEFWTPSVQLKLIY